jgi:hypothetical protein
MSWLAKAVGFGLFAVVVFGITPVLVAEDQALSTWRNDTNMTIRGLYRWGYNHEWWDFAIEPGGEHPVWWTPADAAPPLMVRFDADPGPGIEMVEQVLRVYVPASGTLNKPTESFQIGADGKIHVVNLADGN